MKFYIKEWWGDVVCSLFHRKFHEKEYSILFKNETTPVNLMECKKCGNTWKSKAYK